MTDCARWPAAGPIAAIAVVTHAYSLLVFGAVFWIDGRAYAALGEALSRAGGLRHFYDGVGTWFYSHLQPGLGLLWAALDALPVRAQWPALALFQHGVAAWAMYCFFAALHSRWPSRWNYLACALLGCLPFYQAAHNSFMTESLSSSLLLLGLALALRMSAREALDRRRLLLLGLVILLATQLRSYFGFMLGGAAILVLLNRPAQRVQAGAAVALALALSALAFPAWRWTQTGTFWLPQLGMNKLQAGWWTNPRPSDSVLQRLQALDFPEALGPKAAVNRGLDYDQATAIALHWRSRGLSDLQVNNRAQQAGDLLTGDGAAIYLNRMRQALTSSGLTLAYCVGDLDQIVFPGYSAERLCRHIQSVYQFHGWLSEVDHGPLLSAFFGPAQASGTFQEPFGPEVSAKLHAQIRPWLASTPLGLRDPFRLGAVPPDAWIALAMTAWLLLCLRGGDHRPWVMAVGWIVLANAAVAFAAPLGNPRYGYALVPLYVSLVGLAIRVCGVPRQPTRGSQELG